MTPLCIFLPKSLRKGQAVYARSPNEPVTFTRPEQVGFDLCGACGVQCDIVCSTFRHFETYLRTRSLLLTCGDKGVYVVSNLVTAESCFNFWLNVRCHATLFSCGIRHLHNSCSCFHLMLVLTNYCLIKNFQLLRTECSVCLLNFKPNSCPCSLRDVHDGSMSHVSQLPAHCGQCPLRQRWKVAA
jgi:hypothetical protein